MARPKVKKFGCDVYNVNVVYIYDCTLDDTSKWIHKKFGVNPQDVYDNWRDDMGYTGMTFAIHGDEELFGIWCLSVDDDVTLVHEAVHLADEILNSRGVPIGYDNGEARAYLTSFIYQKARGK